MAASAIERYRDNRASLFDEGVVAHRLSLDCGRRRTRDDEIKSLGHGIKCLAERRRRDREVWMRVFLFIFSISVKSVV